MKNPAPRGIPLQKIMTNKKIILDLCGGTGSWSKPYKDAGYIVFNATLPDFDILLTEIYEDRLTFRGKDYINGTMILCKDIYGILAAPPCTQFSKANWRVKKDKRNFKQGIETVAKCMEIIWAVQSCGAPLKFWALENPLGYLYNFLGKPAFYFQPWEFGETNFIATKRTAIWGYFNPPAKKVRKRTVPYIRDPKTVKGGNPGWGSRSAADLAKTSSFFAESFFKANQ